jgi:hypothetical protein
MNNMSFNATGLGIEFNGKTKKTKGYFVRSSFFNADIDH